MQFDFYELRLYDRFVHDFCVRNSSRAETVVRKIDRVQCLAYAGFTCIVRRKSKKARWAGTTTTTTTMVYQ